MNVAVNPTAQAPWQFEYDTQSVVPGVMVPESNPTPFYTTQLLTEEEADTVYHGVIAQYTSKQLHRVYMPDGSGDKIDLDSRYTHAYDYWQIPLAREMEARINAEVDRVSQMWWNQRSVPVYSPQILGYEEKCRFLSHCDNSIWTNNGWVHNDPMRDVTALLYISDCVNTVTRFNQHSGGNLIYDNIRMAGSPVVVKPKKGQFVMFPSHPMWRHQVTAVTRGYRIAVVNWWSLKK